MPIKTFSSDQARTQWRELLDAVIAGESIIIERYGKPVATLIPYQEFTDAPQATTRIREETAVYQTNQWESIKVELAAEIKAELLSEPTIQHALLQYERQQLHQHEIAHLEEEFANYEQRYPLAEIRD